MVAPRTRRHAARQLHRLRQAAVGQPADRRHQGVRPLRRHARHCVSSGEGRFLLGTDNPGSPNLQAGLAKLPIYTTWGGTAGVAQRFNRLELSVKGSVDRTVYQDSELTDGTTSSNDDRNYNQYRRAGARQLRDSRPASSRSSRSAPTSACTTLPFDRNGIAPQTRSAFTPKAGVTFELTAPSHRRSLGRLSSRATTKTRRLQDAARLGGRCLAGLGRHRPDHRDAHRQFARRRIGRRRRLRRAAARRRPAGRSRVPPLADRHRRSSATASTTMSAGSIATDRRTSLGPRSTYKFSREFRLKGEFRQEWMRSNVPASTTTPASSCSG